MASKSKRGGRGRPPVWAADRRASLVRVLTTTAEHEELQRAATDASMSVSTWVRSVALARARALIAEAKKALAVASIMALFICGCAYEADFRDCAVRCTTDSE